jgi:UDP-N-acetylglucosamine 2-epimerase (non-hydrolysing)
MIRFNLRDRNRSTERPTAVDALTPMTTTRRDVLFVLGTRPEIIKLSPLIRRCEQTDRGYTLVHTGQHYSDSLNEVFFEQLDLPEPDVNLGVGSKPPGAQTGEMLAGVESVLTDVDPDVTFVQGDTNSVLAGAIAACKHDTELAHVEAGLRSFDRTMPEELNRILSDHAADHLFAPTERSKSLLLDEGVPDDRVVVTGNTVVDAVEEISEISSAKSDVLGTLGVSSGQYLLATIHRAENVDDPDRFRDILDGIGTFASEVDLPVIYPIHPRSSDRLARFDVSVPDRVRLVDPQDYVDFLELQRNAALVFTDSGGVQEEACILGVSCVTVRDNTERPESVDVGANVLAGATPETIVECGFQMFEDESTWENPYGDGEATARILRYVDSAASQDESRPDDRVGPGSADSSRRPNPNS